MCVILYITYMYNLIFVNIIDVIYSKSRHLSSINNGFFCKRFMMKCRTNIEHSIASLVLYVMERILMLDYFNNYDR